MLYWLRFVVAVTKLRGDFLILLTNLSLGILSGSTRSTGDRGFSGVFVGNRWTIRARRGLNDLGR